MPITPDQLIGSALSLGIFFLLLGLATCALSENYVPAGKEHRRLVLREVRIGKRDMIIGRVLVAMWIAHALTG